MNSPEYELYQGHLRQKRKERIAVMLTQIIIVIGLIRSLGNRRQDEQNRHASVQLPEQNFAAFVDRLLEGTLLNHVGVTLAETSVGFLLGNRLWNGIGGRDLVVSLPFQSARSVSGRAQQHAKASARPAHYRRDRTERRLGHRDRTGGHGHYYDARSSFQLSRSGRKLHQSGAHIRCNARGTFS